MASSQLILNTMAKDVFKRDTENAQKGTDGHSKPRIESIQTHPNKNLGLVSKAEALSNLGILFNFLFP